MAILLPVQSLVKFQLALIQSAYQVVMTIEREVMLKQEINRLLDSGVLYLCDIEVLPFNGVNGKLVRRRPPVFIE